MRTLYLDIFSGISGDMFIGALLDLGVPERELAAELKKLGLKGYHLHVVRGKKCGIAGTKFDVHVDDAGHAHAHAREAQHQHQHDDHAHEHSHEHSHHEH